MMTATTQLVDEIVVTRVDVADIIMNSSSNLTNQLQPLADERLSEQSMDQANVVEDLIANGTLTTTEDPASVPERLRLRTGKKLSYAEDTGEDDMDWESSDTQDTHEEELPIKKKRKQRADSCSICSLGDNLIYCGACSAAYHLGCLNPPLKVAPRGRWRCPQCADPYAEIEKFLDSQMRAPKRPSISAEGEATATSSSESLTKQYLVKWKSRSYLHCSWIPEADLEKAAKAYPGLKAKFNNFRQKMLSMRSFDTMEDDWAPIRSEWTTVDKVLDFRQTGRTKEYLVKWKELGYEDISWEVEEDIATFQAQIDRFKAVKARNKVNIPKKRKGSTHDSRDTKKKRKKFTAFEETPKYMTGGILHPYQIEGLNFLRFAWQQGKHVILADEMGLGKTIQSIAFVASLMDEGIPSPHLVVAPLSTLRNWEREFSTWAPHMNTVMYVGTAPARTIIRAYEFYFPKVKGPLKKKKQKRKLVSDKQSKQERIKFDILLTSYEMITIDTSILKSFKWGCLIVDEGHRLKNKDSKLFQTLHQYNTRHRVLLTGTPLQNNLDELFMLMHFLDAGKFASLEEFQQQFRDLNQEEQVGRLHKMLAPHLLRRLKKDVMKELPPKKELILRVELSTLQKEYYKAILTRNYQLLTRQSGPQISWNNVAMELRKLCGHPYLLEGVEEELQKTRDPQRQLIEASGKLLLLDKMMVKLKASGHRVLIYSQFMIMLDILEDWMSFKRWSYERIDGSISGAERQIRIDRFNAPTSTRFCFLLSTRAGGLGINLATADTVVIYDSDWNPHADLQAMARAHRLGQANKVMIYRLITRGSIEERMMQLTKKKMVLEHLVVGRLKNQQVLNQEELDDILRYGARELFADESDETKKSQQIHYDDAAIDRLLDRSQVEIEETTPEEEDKDLLKAFKVANFEYVDEEEAAKEMEEKQDSKVPDSEERARYWDDLLKQRFEEQQQRDAAVELGKGKRARKQVLPMVEDDLAGMASVSSDDEDDEATTETLATEPSVTVKEVSEGAEKKVQGSKKKLKVDTTELPRPPPLLEGEDKSLKILGFNRKQRAAFVQILMRFGLGDFSWNEFIPRMKPKTADEIKEYGTLFLTHIAEDISDSPTFSDGLPKEGLRIQDVLVRLAVLHLIQDKVKEFTEDSTAPLFPDDVYKRIPGLLNTRFWKEQQDCRLLQSILRHGYGRWQEMIDDPQLEFKGAVCKELQLPSGGGGSSETDDTKPLLQEDGLQAAGQDDRGASLPSADKQEDFSSGSAFSKDAQSQRTHKRMVEFLKKRVGLLEKALNAEYHQESVEDQKVEEELTEDASTIETHNTGNNSQTELLHFQSSILILLAPEEITAHACDNESKRLDVARIYNEICKLVNESEADAAETYNGNKAAGIRLRKNSRQIDGLCIDMRKAFVTVHTAGLAPAEKSVVDQSSFSTINNPGLGGEVDVLSDEHDGDVDPELNSDFETPSTVTTGFHKLQPCASAEQHQKILENAHSLHSLKTDLRGSTHSLLAGNKDTIKVASFSTFQTSNLPGQSPTLVVLDE